MRRLLVLTLFASLPFLVAGNVQQSPIGSAGGGGGSDSVTVASPGTDGAIYTLNDITRKLEESLVTITDEGTIVQPDQSSIGGNFIIMEEHGDDVTPDPTCAEKVGANQWGLGDVDETDGTIEPAICIGTSEVARFTANGLENAGTGDWVFATHFASAAGTTTGGIQEAINDVCDGSADNVGGQVVLPPGNTDVSTEITVNDCYGLRFVGYGSGNPQDDAATRLTWTGTASPGDYLLRIEDCRGCEFRSFSMEGDGDANLDMIGLLGNNLDSDGGITTGWVTISNLSIRNEDIAGSTSHGTCITMGGASGTPTNDAVGQIAMEEIDCTGTDTMVHQNSNQAVNVSYRNVYGNRIESRCFDFERGFASLEVSGCRGRPGNAVEHLYKHTEFGQLTLVETYHEIEEGGVGFGCEAGAHEGTTSFFGGRFSAKHDGDTSSLSERYDGNLDVWDCPATDTTITMDGVRFDTDTSGYRLNIRMEPTSGTLVLNESGTEVYDNTGTKDISRAVWYVSKHVDPVGNPWGIVGTAATEKTMGILENLRTAQGVKFDGQWTTLYVDEGSGSDSNHGTSPDQALATLHAAHDLANAIGCKVRIRLMSNFASPGDAFDALTTSGDCDDTLGIVIESDDPRQVRTITGSGTQTTTSDGVIRVDSSTAGESGWALVQHISITGYDEDLFDVGNLGKMIVIAPQTDTVISGSQKNCYTTHSDGQMVVIGPSSCGKDAAGAPLAFTGGGSDRSRAFVFAPGASFYQNTAANQEDVIIQSAGSSDVTIIGPRIAGTGTNTIQGLDMAGGDSATNRFYGANIHCDGLGGSGSECFRTMPDGTSENHLWVGYGISMASDLRGTADAQDGLVGPVVPGTSSVLKLLYRGLLFALDSGRLFDYVSGYDCQVAAFDIDGIASAYDDEPATNSYNLDGTTSTTLPTPAGCTAFMADAASADLGGDGTEGNPFSNNAGTEILRTGLPHKDATTPNAFSVDPPPFNIPTNVTVKYVLPIPFDQIALDLDRAGAR